MRVFHLIHHNKKQSKLDLSFHFVFPGASLGGAGKGGGAWRVGVVRLTFLELGELRVK